jgi:hypothetical protein
MTGKDCIKVFTLFNDQDARRMEKEGELASTIQGGVSNETTAN